MGQYEAHYDLGSWMEKTHLHWLTVGTLTPLTHEKTLNLIKRNYRSASQLNQKQQIECLCSECSSGLQLTKVTQQKAYADLPQFLWKLVLGCAQTDSLFESTLQRFHDWLKMDKSSKSSNTTFCILERLVKGKKCLVAVLKPCKNQIQPTFRSF